jgi:hypothetical protein
MRALVVYESLYGNTRAIAEAIADGLRPDYDATVLPVGEAGSDAVARTDLLVVGGPTHVHGMSRPCTRRAGIRAAEVHQELVLDPAAGGPGVREWLRTLHAHGDQAAVAFDTRMKGPRAFTGRASNGITRALRRRGFRVASAPVSFLVTRTESLSYGQRAAAQAWGYELARRTMHARGSTTCP